MIVSLKRYRSLLSIRNLVCKVKTEKVVLWFGKLFALGLVVDEQRIDKLLLALLLTYISHTCHQVNYFHEGEPFAYIVIAMNFLKKHLSTNHLLQLKLRT